MGDNFKGLLSRDYQMFCYTSLKIDFEVQTIKKNTLMNCILAFGRRRQTSFLGLKSWERAEQILAYAFALNISVIDTCNINKPVHFGQITRDEIHT